MRKLAVTSPNYPDSHSFNPPPDDEDKCNQSSTIVFDKNEWFTRRLSLQKLVNGIFWKIKFRIAKSSVPVRSALNYSSLEASVSSPLSQALKMRCCAARTLLFITRFALSVT